MHPDSMAVNIARTLLISVWLYGLCYGTACKQNQFFKDAGPLARTATGSIIGKYVKVFDTDVAAFLGIPYAKAPVGEKRFTKADPIEPWDRILLAQKKPPPCMQHSSLNISWLPTTEPSEDCLQLNIWVPTRLSCHALENLPVLIWIHGGGFSSGSTDMDGYDGAVLAAYGEAIIVTVNYRVGIFGFLNIGNEEAPGNAGLLDQVMAIKWVNENIEYFGGDSNSITLFGESAGSFAISLHLISPSTRNLFHRVIMQSGSMYHPQLLDTSETSRLKVKALAQVVGCVDGEVNLDIDSSAVMKCLKEKDAFVLANAESVVRSRSVTYFMPSVGNEFLPRHAIEYYEEGDIAPVDIMLGNVKDEGTLFLFGYIPALFPLNEEPTITSAEVNQTISALFNMLPSTLHEKIYSIYFQETTKDDVLAITDALQNAFGDFIFNCPNLFLAEKLNNAYMYWMTHVSSKSRFADWFGGHHFHDVFYVFGHAILDNENFTPEDGKFSYDIIQKWVRFARSGYPLKDESKQKWPTFSPSKPTTYELSPRSTAVFDFPRKEVCEFWRSVFKQSIKQ